MKTEFSQKDALSVIAKLKDFSDLEKCHLGFAIQRTDLKTVCKENNSCLELKLKRQNVYKAFDGTWNGVKGKAAKKLIMEIALGSENV